MNRHTMVRIHDGIVGDQDTVALLVEIEKLHTRLFAIPHAIAQDGHLLEQSGADDALLRVTDLVVAQENSPACKRLAPFDNLSHDLYAVVEPFDATTFDGQRILIRSQLDPLKSDPCVASLPRLQLKFLKRKARR